MVKQACRLTIAIVINTEIKIEVSLKGGGNFLSS
jgi:hypothetical protein